MKKVVEAERKMSGAQQRRATHDCLVDLAFRVVGKRGKRWDAIMELDIACPYELSSAGLQRFAEEVVRIVES